MSTNIKEGIMRHKEEKQNGTDSEGKSSLNEFNSWHKEKCRTHLFLILSNIKESFSSVKQGQACIRKAWKFNGK